MDRTQGILARQPVDVAPQPQQQPPPAPVAPRENMEEMSKVLTRMANIHRDIAAELERISATYQQEAELTEQRVPFLLFFSSFSCQLTLTIAHHRIARERNKQAT